MRKTKIVCTLGPSTDKEGILEQLILEGMNVARFNFSHGSHEEQGGRMEQLRKLREKCQKPVAALLDTKGTEIRPKNFKGRSFWRKGNSLSLPEEGWKEMLRRLPSLTRSWHRTFRWEQRF